MSSSDGLHAGTTLNDVRVAAGARTDIDVALTPTGAITTTVLDRATGEPVPSVCVVPLTLTFGALASQMCQYGGGNYSKDDGFVLLGGLAPGTYTLLANPEHTSYGLQWVGARGGTGIQYRAKKITVVAGQSVAAPTVRLDPAASITGVITDAVTGETLTNGCASVLPVRPGDSNAAGGPHCIEYWSEGRYTIPNLGPYEWPVQFSYFYDQESYASYWPGGANNRKAATPVLAGIDTPGVTDAALTRAGPGLNVTARSSDGQVWNGYLHVEAVRRHLRLRMARPPMPLGVLVQDCPVAEVVALPSDSVDGGVVAEFASAVLVAMVQRALAAEGIPVAVPASDGALIPLAAKQRILARVAQSHGLLPLLRVGLSLTQVQPDPAISGLLASSTPHDLFARWSRLERFTHSRHRVLIREAGPECLIAEHVGPPAAPPDSAEDAVILGVLAALTAAIGGQGVTVRLGADNAPVVFAEGVFTAPPPGHDTALWHFTWSSLASTVRPADPGTASHARRVLAGDLGRRWTLGGLAVELGTSPRSLQRRLRADGGFNALLGAARAEAAAHLLMNSEHPLSIVGFASGYADQPHFTRDFKRRTAMTPLAYRSAFADPPR